MDKLIHKADGSLVPDDPYIGKRFLYQKDPHDVVEIVSRENEEKHTYRGVFINPKSHYYREDNFPYVVYASELRDLPETKWIN